MERTMITAEAAALKHFLDAQRASAMAILEGLSDEQCGPRCCRPDGHHSG